MGRCRILCGKSWPETLPPPAPPAPHQFPPHLSIRVSLIFCLLLKVMITQTQSSRHPPLAPPAPPRFPPHLSIQVSLTLPSGVKMCSAIASIGHSWSWSTNAPLAVRTTCFMLECQYEKPALWLGQIAVAIRSHLMRCDSCHVWGQQRGGGGE